MKPRDRFLQWLALIAISLVTLFAVTWVQFRLKAIEIQVAEIHAMTEALIEWHGDSVEL